MPLDRTSANPQENGTPGRLKLVLRLDNKGKAADAKETPAPSTDSRPKRSPHPTKTLSEESFYHGQKIPKKPGVVAEDPSTKEKEDDFRPSRKRKSTMDSDFVFDPIYSKKEGEEEEGDEDVVDTKKHHKKRSHRHGKDTDDIATPPLQEETPSFKLKLKLPKPPPPDTPDQPNKSRKVETPSSGDSKRRRRHEYDDEDEEVTPPRLRVTLKKPVDKKEITPPQTRKAKADSAGGSTKKHSPPKKEEFVPEKRELREKPKPALEPKVPLSEEESVKMKKHLANILGQLIKLDKQMYFTEPVTEDIAPQYFSIIHHPMDFKTMKKKLKDGKYNSLESLQDDFQLICNNCMTYNPASTSYAKEAKRMLNLGNRLLEKFQDVPLGTTTEHKFDDRKKEIDKTPTRQSSFSSTPNKATPNKPATNTTPSHPLTRSATAPSTPSTPLNNSLGVAFPISSGQLSSMQHPISTTPQHAPYPLTPTGLRKPGLPPSAYPPPPLNPNSPYSPRIGAHIPGSPAIPSTITRPPPLLPLQKSQSTNSMLPRTALTPSMPSIPTPALGQRPPAPVGKPGSRPPVVSMTENQAAQTQAMFPEQPKRKYVKLPVEEPVKPPPPAPPVKTPAKLVAKIGTTPLVSPANVPGSFVYSMYIPRFESTQKSSPTETPNSPPSSTPSSSTPQNFASKNYIHNYVSVPSLYLPLPPPDCSPSSDEWRTPSKHTVVENDEVMEAIASDSLVSMDTNSRSQLLKFFEGIATNGLNNSNSLSFPSFATSALLPRSTLHVPLQQPIRPIHKQPLLAPTPTAPPSSSSTPVHATTIPPTVTTHHLPSPTLPTPPSFLIMDSELSEQLDKLETHDITAQDLQQLQGFQIDLSFLSSLITSASTSPVSPTVTTSSSSSSIPSPTTTTTTTTSPLAEPMEITPSSSSQITTPPTSPPTSPPVSSARTPVVVQPDPVKAKKLAQEILDKNLEHLWALQLLQHERIASNPSEAEIKLASQFLDGVFALGTAVPPSMLTSKEAVRAAMDTSGLVTGKRRHMRI